MTGSSLGTLRHELDMTEGETVRWADHSIRLAHVTRTDESDRLVVEAELAISPDHGEPYTLRPAQHLHRLPNVWTTEAAIHPLWSGDFYTILHNGEGTQAHFTFVVNPLLRWIWLGGWVIGFSVLMGLWPEQVTRFKAQVVRTMPRPGHDLPGAPHIASYERSSPSTEVRS